MANTAISVQSEDPQVPSARRTFITAANAVVAGPMPNARVRNGQRPPEFGLGESAKDIALRVIQKRMLYGDALARQRAYDIYMGQEDNFQRRVLLDDLVSKVVIKDKMALSNLREPFSTLSKLASAAKSGSDDLGWYPRLESNQQPPD